MPKGVTGEGRGSRGKPHVCGGVRGSGSGGPLKKLISLLRSAQPLPSGFGGLFMGGGV